LNGRSSDNVVVVVAGTVVDVVVVVVDVLVVVAPAVVSGASVVGGASSVVVVAAGRGADVADGVGGGVVEPRGSAAVWSEVPAAEARTSIDTTAVAPIIHARLPIGPFSPLSRPERRHPVDSDLWH
jgi:hypothetical protein